MWGDCRRYLEMAGRYMEIFSPEMTVEYLVYRFALCGSWVPNFGSVVSTSTGTPCT